MKKVKVLVFPCGSEVGLEIHRSLAEISYVDLIGASSVSDHGRHMYRNYRQDMPFVTSPDFIQRVGEIALETSADFIFPAMDAVAFKLSEERENLPAGLLTSGKRAVAVCQDKLRTYKAFAGHEFCPRFCTEPSDAESYPVFVKPRMGYGSKGIAKIENAAALAAWMAKQDTPQVICEYLSGYEVTVDCFTDRHGALRYASCRDRLRVRNGISVRSALRVPEDAVRHIAEEINRELALRGVWFFQLKQDGNGNYKLLEIATRVAGTMGLQRAVGVNLPLLTVLDAMGYDIDIIPQGAAAEVDRALYNSFRLPFSFDEMYVDFDDTVIVHNRVNTAVIRLLYQCVNRGVPIHLITRHDGDIKEALEKRRISAGLFDSIRHIGSGERKSDVISPSPDALFLDDSFSERLDVMKNHGIRAYGVESVEALLDFRL